MAEDFDNRAHLILRDYRHFMTEAERRADRAFYFQHQRQACSDPAGIAELTTTIERILCDPSAAELFAKGRDQFLQDLVRRVVAQYGPRLPRCSHCGGALKTPHPKQCFDCEDQWPAGDGQNGS